MYLLCNTKINASVGIEFRFKIQKLKSKCLSATEVDERVSEGNIQDSLLSSCAGPRAQ